MKHESSTPTPQERASHPGTYNGLAEWRRRQAEEKARKMSELAEHRKQATTEVRDGKEFKVLRLPDRYDFTALRVSHLSLCMTKPPSRAACGVTSGRAGRQSGFTSSP